MAGNGGRRWGGGEGGGRVGRRETLKTGSLSQGTECPLPFYTSAGTWRERLCSCGASHELGGRTSDSLPCFCTGEITGETVLSIVFGGRISLTDEHVRTVVLLSCVAWIRCAADSLWCFVRLTELLKRG